jgi:hypothetical protein
VSVHARISEAENQDLTSSISKVTVSGSPNISALDAEIDRNVSVREHHLIRAKL